MKFVLMIVMLTSFNCYAGEGCEQPICKKLIDGQPVCKTRAQRICEIRSQYMANNKIRRHVLPHLGYGEGRFEGIGWGSRPDCSTCIGRGKVLGDAVAKSGNVYYRAYFRV